MLLARARNHVLVRGGSRVVACCDDVDPASLPYLGMAGGPPLARKLLIGLSVCRIFRSS